MKDEFKRLRSVVPRTLALTDPNVKQLNEKQARPSGTGLAKFVVHEGILLISSLKSLKKIFAKSVLLNV